jgi:polyphosphate glucokinase
VVDVGGSTVKAVVTGKKRWREFESDPRLTPAKMVKKVRRLVEDWEYDAISLGYPGHVVFGRIVTNPRNLGRGWIGFDFEAAFERPVRVVNDAVLPALGCYKGEKMLFLGLGTGLGSAIIMDGVLEVPNLLELPYWGKRGYDRYLGKRGFKRLGLTRWERHVRRAVGELKDFFGVDYIALGGGNARRLKKAPPDTLLTGRDAAFVGGELLWSPRPRATLGEPIPSPRTPAIADAT